MGRALATFISRLAERNGIDPEQILADALNDPSLKISYFHPELGAHTDAKGHRVAEPKPDGDRAVVQIERHHSEVATITYDAGLADQAAFVEAAGAVAVMHVEATHLEADLVASNKELAASRLRLMEAADTERQRIERDLHDGVQQYIVGLRLRLDLAAEAIHEDPARGERMIGAIGRQVDELLGTLRSFAAGIYPSVLTDYGLRDALESVARGVPAEVSVQMFGIGRYPEDVEVAVYFCCAEAIQNVVKHAGPKAPVSIRLWHVGDALSFEIRDSGCGFDPSASPPGHGLINMRDRIEAVGGKLWVTSRLGWGTSVQGRVPVG
jgi:signal transduction histidine kinase